MRAAIDETSRRREIQLAYNEEHGITAATIVKGISDIAEFLQAESKVPRGRKRRTAKRGTAEVPQHELEKMIVELEEEMLAAAEDLRFEYAAQLRDELRELRRDLQEIRAEEAPRPAETASESSAGDMA
jgi:excinuclease ABC subunit B